MCRNEVNFTKTEQTRHCVLDDDSFPELPYSHEYWEECYHPGDRAEAYGSFINGISKRLDWTNELKNKSKGDQQIKEDDEEKAHEEDV